MIIQTLLVMNVNKNMNDYLLDYFYVILFCNVW